MRKESIEERIISSLEALIYNDKDLLEMNANERTISARLGFYMINMFPLYTVDVEYNRHGLEPKMLNYGDECRAQGEGLIMPDIIVHHRGNDDNNLLVIEIKKSQDTRPRECDFEKLIALKRDYSYQFAAFIEIPTGDDFKNILPNIEWV